MELQHILNIMNKPKNILLVDQPQNMQHLYFGNIEREKIKRNGIITANLKISDFFMFILNTLHNI